MTYVRFDLWVLTAIVAVADLALVPQPVSAAPTSADTPQKSFLSAESAIDELIAANRADNLDGLLAILGPHGAKLVRSGDPIADRYGRERFVAAYDQVHRLEFSGANRAVLVIGRQQWPLPIPLVRGAAGWHFDTQAGEQEILDRRVGRNELNVIEVCRAYVQAQREYASLQLSSGAIRAYARHFMSQPGKRDGLYWSVTAGEKTSPLGPLVAQAREEGYPSEPSRGEPHPYFGYYYRILTRQGTHAAGGAKSYLSPPGQMVGGFALLAYPAEYGNSGIMTFIVNQTGIVFEKNLGAATATLARAIDSYDPDASWRIP